MKFIQPAWSAPKSVKAYTTTRTGGKSLPPYDGFNLALHVGDNPGHAQANRAFLQLTLALPNEPIWIEQVHGTTVIEADQFTHAKTPPVADAAFTFSTNVICAVLTADCVPVLVTDNKARVVAAIHAGWRGLLAGVIESTLAAIDLPGKDLIAWIGPAIGPNQCELGDDIRQQFIAENSDAALAFRLATNGKWLANLFQLAQLRLKRYDVRQIVVSNHCTYTESDQFFSYRRDGEKTGRMATLIWLSDK